jgi:hypothetical protein
MFNSITGAILLVGAGIVFALERAAAQIAWAIQYGHGTYHEVVSWPGMGENPFVVFLSGAGIILILVGIGQSVFAKKA